MAPKKEVCSLGSVQPVGDDWRAEVSNVSKGPTRATLAEAARDLNFVQQANTREQMRTLFGQLCLDARSTQSLEERDGGAGLVILLQHVAPQQDAAAGNTLSPRTVARSTDAVDYGASPPKKARTGTSNQAL